MSATDSQRAASRQPKGSGLLLSELPFVALLVLTIAGVAYTSFSKQPLIVYWELLAPLIGVACVAEGWRNADDGAARRRLILTQTLHWLAFLVVMNLLLLPGVQRIFTANSTGLRNLHSADARRLHGGRARAVLAIVPARSDHGARHSCDRLD